MQIKLLGFFVSVYPVFFQTSSYLNELRTSIFIAIEPIGANIDFTQPYGVEQSFSHDYVWLFRNASFSLWYESKVSGKIHEDYFGIFGAINT